MTDINWDLVEEQKKINTHKRLNWKLLFGKSLTRVIAEYKAQGLNQDEVFAVITSKYGLTDDAMRRLRIGVAARFGEINSEQSAKEQLSNK